MKARDIMFDKPMYGVNASYTTAGGWQPIVPNDKWFQANSKTIACQKEIDIGGLTVAQEGTFFPKAVQIQRSPFYSAPGCIPRDPNDPLSPLAPYGVLFETILVSEHPFDVTKWCGDQQVGTYNFIQSQTVPGLLPERTTLQNQTLGFENILYGRIQMIANNSSLPQQCGVVYSSEEFGSMSPTASNKLYVTRMIEVRSFGLAPPQNSAIIIPAMRLVMIGRAEEENDLSYIMRMRQSYLLAQDLN